MVFRQPLLVRVNIERRDMIRMFPQLGEEAALAGADFQHPAGQGQGFLKDELHASSRIVSKSPEQCLAFGYDLVALGFKQ
jgi:hypothetical protein